MTRTMAICLLVSLTLSGCGGITAEPGKVKITSTEAFSKTHASKSPPPKKPAQ